MSDIEHRLVALDPAAQSPYEHADLEAMISRVTSVTVAPPQNHTWRNFKLKMASAVAASALITVGAVTAFTSGPALSAISLASIVQPATGAATTGTSVSDLFATSTASPMQRYEQLSFSPGPSLDIAPPAYASYPIVGPDDPATEAQQIGAAFEVTEQLKTSNNNTEWYGTNANGGAFNYGGTGIGEWSFQSNSTEPTFTSPESATAAIPSKATVVSDVQQYMSSFGFNYTLSAPSFGEGTSNGTNNAGAGTYWSTRDVYYTALVGGLPTPYRLEFSFDAKNNVVSASGPAFVVGTATEYPLRTFKSAISELNQEQAREYSGAAASETTPAPVAATTLTSVGVSLTAFTTTLGQTWLLPSYKFVGETNNADGTITTGSWGALAVEPTYVNASVKTETFTISGSSVSLIKNGVLTTEGNSP